MLLDTVKILEESCVPELIELIVAYRLESHLALDEIDILGACAYECKTAAGEGYL